MKKKLLGILFVLGLLLALPSMVSFAETKSGTCGATGNEANVTWVLDDNGTLTISGTGNMKDYDSVSYIFAPWYDARINIQTVVIGSGVTRIGNWAFYQCANLKSVTIPNSVTSIGSYAFRSCTSLTSATIPNSVTSIGGYIFDGCKSLKSVTIPISVTSIEEGSFRDCKSLTSVKIPNSVTSIGGYAFSSCTSLTSVTMPDSVESIGGSTFWYCSNLQSVTIPKKVTSIEESTFEYCRSLTSVKIPNSVTSIGSKAFKHCASLTTMTIPNSVTSIGSDAFSSCTSLTSVTMPDSVESIGGSTFWYCSNLQSVTIPKKVTSIGEHAFVDCTSLTTIYMPMHYDTESKTYKELGVDDADIPVTATKLYYIAGAAEGNITPVTIDSVTYGNGKEKSITLPCDIMGNGYVIQSAKEGTQATINHNHSEIYTPVTGGNLSAKCKICSGVVTMPGPIDPYANLVISETVTVGESEQLPVTAISGGYTESGYTTVTVPKDVKYISKGAFYTNENLDTIYLPEGCQMESESVPLTTKIVYYKVNKDERGNAVVRTSSTGEEITQVTVSRVDVLKPDQELNLNNIYGKYEITAIDDDALDNSGKNLHTVILPNSVESINARVFENCKNLETIYLKEGCTIENEGNIADKNLIYYTDDGATISSAKINIDNFQLELSQIRNGIGLKIGENAFKDQVKMKSVTIPATVTSIGTNPFAGCTGLQTITVEEGNTAYKIENGVLLSKDGKTLVCYPAGNTGTTCTTPESVTAIAAQAFADCKKLENVVLRENVTSVGADAFTGCDKLKAVYAQKDCDIDSTVLNSENIIYYIVTNEDVSSKEVTIGKTTEDYNDSLAGGQNCIINRAGTELDLNVLNNTGLYKITCIGAGAFYQEASKQHNLKRIIIPEGVTEVKGGFLRYSQGLESVKLPTTLEGTLPRYSITDNKVLKTLTIPHQVTNIDSEAFTATTGLETVYVPSTITDITPITNYSSTANIIYFNIPTTYGSKTSTPIEICIGGNSADSGNKNNLPGSCKINREGSTVDLRTIDGNYKIKEIGTSAFSGWQNDGSAENLKEIVIPEGVTDIAKEAFRFCGKLTSITLPTTYSNGLHRYFITDNQNLKTLVVPHGVTEINSEAFTEVTGLTRVFLKDGFVRGSIFNNSPSAKFIRYGLVNNDPQNVKITDASEMSDVEKVVYCDEMGDRYVITGNNSSKVTLKHRGDVEVPAKEATCEKDGTKAYWKCLCGANNCTEKGSGDTVDNLTIAATGHTSLSEVPAKAATFHACGVKAHYKCDGCGKLFSDGSATTELNDNDVNISEHQGHNFGAYSHDYENQALHADVCALKGTVAATCAICDQTDVKACAEHTKSSHVWEEKITPATCTTEGKAEYTCSLCNEPETKILEIDPNNHTYGEVEYTWSDDYTACTAKRVCNNDANHVETEEATVTSEATQEATCTQAEVTTYTATFNKEVFKKQTKVVTGEIDSNNHDYSIEVEGTAREATCTAKGKEADKKCSRCEAVQTGKEIEIDPNNHDYSIEVEGTAKEATCTAKGKEADKKCSRCEAVQTGKEIEIDPNNHDYSIEVEGTAREATCTAKGKEADKKCSRCEAVQTGKEIEIDPNNHDYSIEVEGTAKEATCTAKGKEADKKCSRCEAVQTGKEIEIDPNNHDYSIEVEGTAKEATCTAKGKEADKKCSRCEAVQTGKEIEIDPNNHDYSIEVEGTAKEATCTAKGKEADKKCSRCEAVQTGKEIEIDPNNHTNLEKTEAVAATCTKDGNEVYWYCSGCGKYFADEACTTETNISKLTRPATGHTYGEVEYTWSNDYGTCTAKRVCQNDTGHVETENATKITENIIKAATCEGVGKKTYTASFASFGPSESGVVAIPATGHKCNDTWEHNETQHWKVCETCKENVNAANHTDENSDGMCDVCGYVTTPDTYTVSGTVYTWDNTDSNTTRVRLYSSTTSEADIKSDIQHDITDESYTKTCQYDAKLIGDMEKESTSNRYTQSFEFTGVANGEYKLAAWRPAYDISNKHYAYVVRITDVTVNGAEVTVDENATKLWLYGDVNGDGKIDAGDATNILAYVIGKSSSIDEDNKAIGDVNDDGNVDAGDATNVLAYIIGKSSILDDKK